MLFYVYIILCTFYWWVRNDLIKDQYNNTKIQYIISSGLILGLHPANERRRYEVTPSLNGWAQT